MSLIKREGHAGWPLETLWSPELVDSTFRDMLRHFFSGEGILDRMSDGGAHFLRVEEYVEDGTCVIRAELPGLDPQKDIDLTVSDGVLHLSAQREERTQEDRPDGYHSEFRYGRMARNLRLPEGATEADVSATYKNGILEVRVPAPQEPTEPTATTIPITEE